MSQEYISSSRPAILGMANRLCVTGVNNTTKPRIEDIDKKVSSIGGKFSVGLNYCRRTAISLMRWRRTRSCFNKQGFPPIQSLWIRRLASMGYQRLRSSRPYLLYLLNGTNINLKVIVIITCLATVILNNNNQA